MAQFLTRVNTFLDQPLARYSLGTKMFTQDNKANRIEVTLYKGNEKVDAVGTITGLVSRNDGKAIAFHGGIENGAAYIELPEAAYAVDGPISIMIRETVDDIKTVIAVCDGYVTKTADAEYVASGSIVMSIDDMINKLDELEPFLTRLREANIDTVQKMTEKLEELNAIIEEAQDILPLSNSDIDEAIA